MRLLQTRLMSKGRIMVTKKVGKEKRMLGSLPFEATCERTTEGANR